MEKKWFKRKTYGWGWTPATWQGWLITVLFIAAILFVSFSYQHSADSIEYYVILVILTTLLIAIAYSTGERPRWQWGKK